METFLGRYRNLIVLAAILFAQLIGLAVQVKLPSQQGQTRLIRFWAVAAITPFEKAVVHTQNWVRDTWRGYLYLHGVRRENRQLRAQIERMKLDEMRLNEDAKMARRIQALLAFKEQYVEDTVAAQVIGTSGSDQSRVLYIDKGSRDGIKGDMAVITPTGIVGKVVQVFPESSQVLPINDQLSGVGAALKDTRLQGILKGAPNGTTTLQYVMADEKVEPGEEVITSGGDRIFPKGLPVGKVVSVEPGKDLFLNIRIVPTARLDRLEEVLVVTKITEKPPDTKDLGPIRAADILAARLPTYQTPPPPAAMAGNVATGVANAAGAAGGTATTPPAGAGGTAARPNVGAAGIAARPNSGAANVAGAAGGTATTPAGAAGTAARPNVGAAGIAARPNAGTANAAGTTGGAATTPTAAGAASAAGRLNGVGAGSSSSTATAGVQTRTATPVANGVTKLSTTTGVNSGTRSAGTVATPPNGGASTQNGAVSSNGTASATQRNSVAKGTSSTATPRVQPGSTAIGAASSDGDSAATATSTQQRPIKKVIVEPDPLPVRKVPAGTANSAAPSNNGTGLTPKPVQKPPQQAAPNPNPAPTSQPEGTNPQR